MTYLLRRVKHYASPVFKFGQQTYFDANGATSPQPLSNPRFDRDPHSETSCR